MTVQLRTISVAATIDKTGERSDVERQAEIHGEHFGVFRLAPHLWNVTHVPTGYLVTHAGSKPDAIEFVKRIGSLADWSTTDVNAIQRIRASELRAASEGLSIFRDIYALSTGYGLNPDNGDGKASG